MRCRSRQCSSSSASAPLSRPHSATYGSGFIEYWLQRLLYYEAPPWVFIAGYSLWWGLALVALFWGIDAWRKRKAPKPANEAAPQA